MLLDIDGILLFTNADRGADDVRLEQFAELLVDDNTMLEDKPTSLDQVSADAVIIPVDVQAQDGGVTGRDPSIQNETTQDDFVAFDPRNMPEEPLLVEMLQILNRPPRAPKKRMIAVVVSAWDEIDEPSLAPEDWLRRNRPMVWQFLRCNSALWKVRVYGVSAQGGRLPQDKVALQGKVPGQRVQIVGHGARPHDLTAPIEWLMTLN
jgi:hypothetical protein